MASLGILSFFNSSGPAFTWADIKALWTDEGAVIPLHFELYHPVF